MKQQSIFAVAISERQALQIETRLTEAGFSNDEISALIPDTSPDGSSGGVLGGAMDLLASIGALAVPGVGRLIAAGPILATLTGIAATAAVGIGGALVSLGVSETVAKHYESRISGGDILISVHAATAKQVEKARKVLESANAQDIAVALVPAGLC